LPQHACAVALGICEAALRLDKASLEPIPLGIAQRRILELRFELRDPVAPLLDVAGDPVDLPLEVDDLRLLLQDRPELREAGDRRLDPPDRHPNGQGRLAVLLAARPVVHVRHVAAELPRRADRALDGVRKLVVVGHVELDVRAVVLGPRGGRDGRGLAGGTGAERQMGLGHRYLRRGGTTTTTTTTTTR
jgi:hypothetical protein